jgi:hypothetical protein
MTTTDTATRATWRLLAVTPVVTLVVVAVLWNGAALAVDASSLEQGIDSWGYAFGTLLLTAVLGSAAGVLTASCALAALAGPSGWARASAWAGAVVDALCGVALLVAAVSLFTDPAAGMVLGLVTVPLALVLGVPLALCTRRARAG